MLKQNRRVTVEQVAAMTGESKKTIGRLIKDKEIPHRMRGKKPVLIENDIDIWWNLCGGKIKVYEKEMEARRIAARPKSPTTETHGE
jgi:excisionase family DNA binding protein